MTNRHDVVLKGCSPYPLAHYLKALAILRLVGEQVDPKARGRWANNNFVLTSTLDAAELVAFLLEEYEPTPVVAPWNGGSGFNENDNTNAIDAIRTGSSERHADYRGVIETCFRIKDGLGSGREKVDSGDDKEELLTACRGRLSENFVGWFDAAAVLTSDGPKYPPILGTGGNDGRLDFTNNFMQRLNDVVDPETGRPTAYSRANLRSALFGNAVQGHVNQTIGQFLPGLAGGSNAGAGFDGRAAINPWDFVFMIEGALLFAASSTRRLESARPGAFSYPFTVRTSGAGYGSASVTDEESSRAEIWLPLWDSSSSVRELKRLFAEGRATVSGKEAVSGADFARAAATLGVDRGITAFQRIGFQERNGLAYFAVSLGRVPVRHRKSVELLDEIDSWLARLRYRLGDKGTPASVKAAGNKLERAIFAFASNGSPEDQLQLLMALGDTEAALAASHSWTKTSSIRPLMLRDERWHANLPTSSELRIARGIASITGSYGEKSLPFRRHVEPITPQLGWAPNVSGDVVWTGVDLIDDLHRILLRRAMAAGQNNVAVWPDHGIWIPISDVVRFLEGVCDDQRISRLARALSLCARLAPVSDEPKDGLVDGLPGAAYAAFRLAFSRSVAGEPVPISAQVLRLATNGDSRSLGLALRHLRSHGVPLAVESIPLGAEAIRRAASAIMLAISPQDQSRLERHYLLRAVTARQRELPIHGDNP